MAVLAADRHDEPRGGGEAAIRVAAGGSSVGRLYGRMPSAISAEFSRGGR